MSQFLGFVILFVIAGGLVLQAGVEMPWYLDWVGRLPGDILIKKGGVVFYVPLTSSVLVSALLSFLASLFSGKK